MHDPLPYYQGEFTRKEKVTGGFFMAATKQTVQRVLRCEYSILIEKLVEGICFCGKRKLPDDLSKVGY